MLYKTQPDTNVPIKEDLEKAVLLMDCLRKWASPQILSGPRSHMVEVWRLGTMVYLGQLFPVARGSPDNPSVVHDLFRHAKEIPRITPWGYGLLWPLFQAGLTLRDEDSEDKDWIRYWLKSVLGILGCRQDSIALETLELVWESRNVHYNSITAGMQWRRLMLG